MSTRRACLIKADIPSAADQKALNLAIRDEIAALEWVQCNIGAFGGDRDKVRWRWQALLAFNLMAFG